MCPSIYALMSSVWRLTKAFLAKKKTRYCPDNYWQMKLLRNGDDLSQYLHSDLEGPTFSVKILTSVPDIFGMKNKGGTIFRGKITASDAFKVALQRLVILIAI